MLGHINGRQIIRLMMKRLTRLKKTNSQRLAMLQKVSLKIKILALSVLVILSLLLLGLSAIGALGGFNQSVRQGIERIDANVVMLADVSNAHVRFKIQVQEGKNILIRGNDAERFNKYLKQFNAESDQVQGLLASAIERARSLGKSTEKLAEVRNAHADLKLAYLNGLKAFDAADPLTGKKVDKLVSGIDRAASGGMEEIATETEQRFAELIKITKQEMQQGYESSRRVFALIMLVSAAIVVGLMVFVFLDLFRLLGAEPAYAAQVLDEVANGNLGVHIQIKPKDTESLISRVESMRKKLSEVIQEVRSAAEELASASEQVSATAQSLSQGASLQASSVEQVSASIEQILSSITQNSENSNVTSTIAAKSAQEAAAGGEAVASTVESIQEIAQRITVIDDIAYQTNLLALNAAIEAGRAGEHGRGFDVVASEVRKLAQRSQVAAQEISELAKSGVQRAEVAGKSFKEMVPSIRKTADLVQEISEASAEQAAGVQQVNVAIGQVTHATQQNAAASEELTSTAEEMSSQAEGLQQTVGYFKLNAIA